MPITIVEPTSIHRTITNDIMTGEHVLTVDLIGGVFFGPGRLYRLDPTGTVLGHRMTKRCSIWDDDPLSAKIEVDQTAEFERDDWRVRLETSTVLKATTTRFEVTATARAFLGSEVVHEKEWRFVEPRDFA